MHLPPLNLPEFISKHQVTVHTNAGGDNHTINFISDQCLGLIAARKTGLVGNTALARQ
jgi:hypothetical protein